MKFFTVKIDDNAQLDAYIPDDAEYPREDLKRPAAVICPGGGYAFVSKDEGEPVAFAFLKEGYAAFVLRYSTGIENPFPTALRQLAKSIKYVRDNADALKVIKDDVTVAGFSAGGNLALSSAVYCEDKVMLDGIGSTEEVRPDAIVLGYPAVTLIPVKRKGECKIDPELMKRFAGPTIRQILLGKTDCSEEEYASLNLLNKLHKNMPPVFVWGTYDDQIIPVEDLTGLASGLKKLGVSCELHMFEKGGHGMSLGTGVVKSEEEIKGNHVAKWFRLAILWLEERRRK